jgi:hypothetical protein
MSVALIAIFGVTVVSFGQESNRPLRVVAQRESGPYYVGQAIRISVFATAEAERPKVTAPRIAPKDATLAEEGTGFEAISTTAIGDVVSETNRFAVHYRLIPRHSGALTVPPFVARLGNRSGTSAPLRLEVRDVPSAGRPNTFLGGVGPIEIAAEAKPATVRVGQSFEYRVLLRGPGARGSTQPPDVSRIRGLPIGASVQELPVEDVVGPPSRVFRYRIRTTRPGETTLPPVAVSWFDPKSERFMTKASSSVPIRVAAVPAFDATSFRYQPVPAASSRLAWFTMTTGGVLGLGVAAAMLTWVRRRLRRRVERDPARLAQRIVHNLLRCSTSEQAGRVIAEGLAEYLNVTAGRPSGALTPDEARGSIERLCQDPAIAARASFLISECDRARFEENGSPRDWNASEVNALISEACALLDTLSRVSGAAHELPRNADEATPPQLV